MSHPPEPWAIKDGEVVAANGDTIVMSLTNEPLGDYERIFSERIVACVNACAGIPTADLIGRLVQPHIIVQDVYRDGDSVMMATEEVLVFGNEVVDVNVIEAQILEPREGNDLLDSPKGMKP